MATKNKKRKAKKLHPPKTGWLLKLKAKIYRYTGLYLADKEKNDYIESEYFCKELTRAFIASNDMSLYTTFSLLIGMWECNHGFTRPTTHAKRWYYPAIKVAQYVIENYLSLKWDLQSWWNNKK